MFRGGWRGTLKIYICCLLHFKMGAIGSPALRLTSSSRRSRPGNFLLGFMGGANVFPTERRRSIAPIFKWEAETTEKFEKCPSRGATIRRAILGIKLLILNLGKAKTPY